MTIDAGIEPPPFVTQRKLFHNARYAPESEQKALWVKAAESYAEQLNDESDGAPEAAMNAAYAYKHAGEFDKGRSMYLALVRGYGSEVRLQRLEVGDSNTQPDPTRYQERVHYVHLALVDLAATGLSMLHLDAAAGTFETIAANPRFAMKDRTSAARKALALYSTLSLRDRAQRVHARHLSLTSDSNEREEAAYLFASYDFAQWDPRGHDTGTNRDTRNAAEQSLQQFAERHKGNPAASSDLFEAGHRLAQLRAAGKSR
jgi:hypothetical protein